METRTFEREGHVRLALATSDLVLEGRSFEGFPLLLDHDGWPLEPAQAFLWHALVNSGGIESKLTWEDYGRRLYDFFAFLEANGLNWDQGPAPHGLSVVAKYCDWSLGELGLNPSTVNKRLNLVVRFYQWSKSQGYVSHLPCGCAMVAHGSDVVLFAAPAGTSTAAVRERPGGADPDRAWHGILERRGR